MVMLHFKVGIKFLFRYQDPAGSGPGQGQAIQALEHARASGNISNLNNLLNCLPNKLVKVTICDTDDVAHKVRMVEASNSSLPVL